MIMSTTEKTTLMSSLDTAKETSKAKGLVEELIQIYPDDDSLHKLLKKVEKEELYNSRFEFSGAELDRIKINAKLEVLNELVDTIHVYGRPFVREKITHLKRVLGEINV